jgi:pterin-4a-carbinolamine dehydratase
VDVQIYTHKVRGLTESDFVLAAKIDELYFAGQRAD